MFTSRAEYRLSLRADNADQRLTALGIKINLVKKEREKYFIDKQKKITQVLNDLNKFKITPNEAAKHDIKIAKDGIKRTALQVLGHKNVDMHKIRSIWTTIAYNGHGIDTQLEIDAHYSGYVPQQSQDIKSFKKDEQILIPKDINYDSFSSLSNEIKFKLNLVRPATLGQAIRIDGVTPAAILIILGYIKRAKHQKLA